MPLTTSSRNSGKLSSQFLWASVIWLQSTMLASPSRCPVDVKIIQQLLVSYLWDPCLLRRVLWLAFPGSPALAIVAGVFWRICSCMSFPVISWTSPKRAGILLVSPKSPVVNSCTWERKHFTQLESRGLHSCPSLCSSEKLLRFIQSTQIQKWQCEDERV